MAAKPLQSGPQNPNMMELVLNDELPTLIHEAANESAQRVQILVVRLASAFTQETSATKAYGGFGTAPKMNELAIWVSMATAPALRTYAVRVICPYHHRSRAASCSTVGDPRIPSGVL